MKQLILVRHAEAVEPKAGRADFDRPLLPEGEKQAQSMAKKMKKEDLKIDLLISSPADRALETAHIFARRLDYPIQRILLFDTIYKSTDGPSLLNLIRDMDHRYTCMLMVGHNPGLSELAKHLVKGLRLDIPKGGAVRVEFSTPSWKEVGPENARLISFDIPGSVAKAEKWHKKIRRELAARMARQNMAILERLDKGTAAKIASSIKESSKKTASRFVREARNFSLDDLSWLEGLEEEPKAQTKSTPLRRRVADQPKSQPARQAREGSEKQVPQKSRISQGDSVAVPSGPDLSIQKEPEAE